MTNFSGEGRGPLAAGGNERTPAPDDGDAEHPPVDLKATVTLSGEALAALLEEVKHTRRTVPGVAAITTPLPNTIAAPVAPPEPAKRSDKAAAKPDAKPGARGTDGKTDTNGEGRGGWLTRGWGQPTKRRADR